MAAASQPAHPDRPHQVVGKRRPQRDGQHLAEAAQQQAVQAAPGLEVGVDGLGGGGALFIDLLAL